MVTLSGGSDTGRASVEEDYELTVVREGESIDGPDWTVPSDDGPAPSADPILPLTGPAAADGSTTTDGASPGSSADANSTDSDEAADAQDSTQAGFLGLSLPVAIGIAAALGLVVLVGAGVLVAVLTRRNRNP